MMPYVLGSKGQPVALGQKIRFMVADGNFAGTPKLSVDSAGPLVGSKTFDTPSLVDAAGTSTTVTVTGAVLGDFVKGVSLSVDLQGITVTGYVSAADTVTVRFQNESAGTLDLASATLRVVVWPKALFGL